MALQHLTELSINWFQTRSDCINLCFHLGNLLPQAVPTPSFLKSGNWQLIAVSVLPAVVFWNLQDLRWNIWALVALTLESKGPATINGRTYQNCGPIFKNSVLNTHKVLSLTLCVVLFHASKPESTQDSVTAAAPTTRRRGSVSHKGVQAKVEQTTVLSNHFLNLGWTLDE